MVNKKTIPKAFFSKIAFSSFLCLTLVTILVLGWKTWNSYRKVKMFQEQNFRIQGLIGTIMHLDEVLTMSARMAAETGDFKWEERYLKFEPQLDAAINEAKKILPEAFLAKAANETDTANTKLVAMEKRAFKLVRQGKGEDASAILFSEEYQKQKQVYAQGMKLVKTSMQDHIADVLKKYRRYEFLTILTFLTVLPALFFSFMYILLSTRRRYDIDHTLKEQLQSILDNTIAVIYIKDKSGKYILINRQYETLFHITREDIIGKTDMDIFPKEMAEAFRANDLKVLNAGRPMELEEIAPHDDGPHTYISIKFPIFNLSGIPERICGISTDITERKRAEEILRESEAKYNRLTENLQDNHIFYSHDTNGIFTYVSPSITNVLGYTSEEFLTHYSEYMTDSPCNKEVIRHTDLSISGLRPPPYEVELYHKDGSIRTLKIQEVPAFDNNHNVIAVEGIAEDITQHKHAEEKFVNYQSQLKRLSSALSLTEERERRQISEGLHDKIGQSLTVIKMKLEELQEPQADTDTGRVLDETWELLDKTIKDLRTLTFEISPPILYELGFESAVEWLVEQFREQHNISIDFVSSGLNVKLNEDICFFLFKAVRELLFNIIKHARADSIKILALRKNNKIRISIEDDGGGFNISKVRFSVNELNGFGLFSIRERMEYFGGQFDIKSKSGRGTRITLVMPLTQQKGDAGAER